MKLHIKFKSITEEIASKVDSMLMMSDVYVKKFNMLCADKFVKPQQVEINNSLLFAKSINPANGAHARTKTYINHPVRIATMVLEVMDKPDKDSVIISLLHNIYEVGGLTESDLRVENNNEEITRAIRLLTIDRNLQRNCEYLENYYNNIKNFSRELMLIRCIDKLDNLLKFELVEEGDTRTSYLDLCSQFIVPMANELDTNLGNYIKEIILYMIKAGCKQELKNKYDL